jgi:hypothetical protein
MQSVYIVVLVLALACPLRAADLKVFFGNLHAHTAYSDGSGTPSQAYKMARDSAKMDYYAITEHNHKSAERSAVEKNYDSIGHRHALYNGPQSSSLIRTAGTYTQAGRFVALYGQEFSTTSKGNHVNVFEIGSVIDENTVENGRFDMLVDWLKANKDSQGSPAIIQFNHPKSAQREDGIEYGADDFGDVASWRREMGKHAALISVLNGPSHDTGRGLDTHYVTVADYRHYLNLGFKLGPTADQDTHHKNWGIVTDARTAVVTDELTKPKILEALRKRRVYATQDKNLRLIFWVQGALCGDVVTNLPAVGSHLNITFTLKDDDEPDADYRIEVFSDKVGGPVASQPVEKIRHRGNTTTPISIPEIEFEGAGQFILFRIIQEGDHDHEDIAYTSPVWFESGAAPLALMSVQPTAGVFIASKNSAVYHISEACRRVKQIAPENRLTGVDARKHRTLHVGCPAH